MYSHIYSAFHITLLNFCSLRKDSANGFFHSITKKHQDKTLHFNLPFCQHSQYDKYVQSTLNHFTQDQSINYPLILISWVSSINPPSQFKFIQHITIFTVARLKREIQQEGLNNQSRYLYRRAELRYGIFMGKNTGCDVARNANKLEITITIIHRIYTRFLREASGYLIRL